MKIRKLTEFVLEWKVVDGLFGFVPLGLSRTFQYHNRSNTLLQTFPQLAAELPVSKAANAAAEAMKTARQYLRLGDLKRWAE